MGDREQVPRGVHMHLDGRDRSNARVSTLHRDVGRYRVQHGVVLRDEELHDRDLRVGRIRALRGVARVTIPHSAPRRSHYELGGRMG